MKPARLVKVLNWICCAIENPCTFHALYDLVHDKNSLFKFLMETIVSTLV